jgi:2'-5' RNA ligase superfamily
MPLPAPPDPHRLIHGWQTRWLPGLRWINVLPVSSPGPHSGLIVAVPEAEPAVARHRQRLDANAPLGVPAHITVLFPFMPPKTIGPPALAELENLFAAVSRFRLQLNRTAWFGDDVLWLAPRDPGPFHALTNRVYQAFPAYPPFEGQFNDVIPHLTVGHGHPINDLRAAEESVQPHLPINAHATAVTLMTQQSAGGHWTKATTFTLA